MTNILKYEFSNNLINKSESDSDKKIQQLYIDCEEVYSNLYTYAPKNELDNELFNSITTYELLKKNNIIIEDKINSLNCCEQFSIGKICLYNDNYNKCNLCELIIPFDMNFYSNKSSEELEQEDIDDKIKSFKDKYNLCKICYNENIESNKNLNKVKISTGIENINDWVSIFTIKEKYFEYGYDAIYYYNFFCNLNKNSSYYKKFASNSYIEMLGESFQIIEQNSLEEILNKYYK